MEDVSCGFPSTDGPFHIRPFHPWRVPPGAFEPRPWDQRNSRPVLKKSLAKAGFEFTLFHVNHDRESDEKINPKQRVDYAKTAAQGPSGKVTQMGEVDGVAHASVQSCSDQLLLVFAGTKFGFSAELVTAKLRRDPPVNAQALNKKRQCGKPHPWS